MKKQLQAWLLLGIACVCQCYNKNTMPKDFCSCLIEKDWSGVKKTMDTSLAAIDKNMDDTARIAEVKKWLEQQPCIKAVALQPGMVETDPPIKRFVLTVSNNGADEERILGVQVSKTNLKVNIY